MVLLKYWEVFCLESLADLVVFFHLASKANDTEKDA